jgi:SAM-dependent methyltransferase
VAKLMDEYAAVAEWDVSTRQANEGFIRRTIKPALGPMKARKVRGPILDKLYAELKRCGDLSCTGRPFNEHRCRFVLASAESLTGIADASVDVVTTRSVLIYVKDKAAALREFYRVLRPGGRISVFEPVNVYQRASAARAGHLDDPRAVEVLVRLDYPFERFDLPCHGLAARLHALRVRTVDAALRRVLAGVPDATVVALGEGFETQFWRVDNGRLRWLTLDLPEVVAVRREVLPDGARNRTLTGSALDPEWTAQVDRERPVIITAQGLLPYFERDEVHRLLTAWAGTVGDHEDARRGAHNSAAAGQSRRPHRHRRASLVLRTSVDCWPWNDEPRNSGAISASDAIRRAICAVQATGARDLAPRNA